MEFVVAVEDRKFKESIVEASVLEKFLKGCVFHVVGPDNKIVEKTFRDVQSNLIYNGNDAYGNFRLIDSRGLTNLTPVIKLKVDVHKVVGYEPGILKVMYNGKVHELDVTEALKSVSNEEYQKMLELKRQKEAEKKLENDRLKALEEKEEKDNMDKNLKLRELASSIVTPNIDDDLAKSHRIQIEEEIAKSGKSVTLDMIMDSNKLEENVLKDIDLTGISTCPICNGAGYYIGDLGIKYTCSCVAEKQNRVSAAKERFETYKPIASAFDIDTAVMKGIIPEHKKNQEYSRELYQKTLNKLCYSLKLGRGRESIANYFDTLDNILMTIRDGRLPEISYMLYSLNGCGKGTFAITCLKVLFAQNKKCVPYITVKELAEKRVEYNKKLTFGKVETEGIDGYTWKDYINADLVFTQVANGGKDPYLEFDVLSELLTMRASKNKPTIVFLERPVSDYMNNSRINETFMLNHYTDLKALATMSRLYDVSMILGIPKKKKEE